MTAFSDEQKKILEQYVTDVGGDIFVVKNLSGIAGAVYARYSRAKLGFQETLLKEFIEDGQIDPIHADKLIERVLIAYGDDSVGELEGVHMSFENISMLATKEIEDRRIGASPIEKSTRYVFFGEKDEAGQYKYVREPSIMASPFAEEYIATLDNVFDTYNDLVEPMQKFYQELFPIEKAEYDVIGHGTKQTLAELSDPKDKKAFQITYNMDQRTKACDTLRCLLPLATKTNMGIFGNGRFYQMLISHLWSTGLPEVENIGTIAHRELSKIIPQYVRRAAKKEYNMAVNTAMYTLAQELLADVPVVESGSVTLPPLTIRNTHDFLLAHMLYGYTAHPLMQLYKMVQQYSEETKDRIRKTYVGKRTSRRDRPGRAFESGYTYTFDLFADYGTFKDLERHRMTTQLRQTFSPIHGFEVPQDLIDAGFADRALACHDSILTLYKKLLPVVGQAASYVTLHGNKIRWIMGFNDREAMHLLELRTTKQGHPQYRRLCQQMHKAIEAMDPWRASVMNFVDHNAYDSARGDSEARQRVKERLLGDQADDEI